MKGVFLKKHLQMECAQVIYFRCLGACPYKCNYILAFTPTRCQSTCDLHAYYFKLYKLLKIMHREINNPIKLIFNLMNFKSTNISGNINIFSKKYLHFVFKTKMIF